MVANDGPFDAASLPDDAVELGRFHGPYGVKGWIHVQAYSPDAEVLFKAKEWFLMPPSTQGRPAAAKNKPAVAPAIAGPSRVQVQGIKSHSDGIVVHLQGLDDRTQAESLKGVRIFVSRAAFPAAPDGEFYWVDLIGLQVVNREGVDLGQVHDLMPTGPHSVLVLRFPVESDSGHGEGERMIPFVDAYIDEVDTAGKRIVADWQPDY
ncbi:ribosome maturation factor RimM [Hydrogenophaga sp. 5NK40-0174]|uniref:ribosome maturation factor RimM n=1 Tax=Hydrogenophaga sp. 5NK40-0174 TaxID=3127649 RepID=UPI003105C84E